MLQKFDETYKETKDIIEKNDKFLILTHDFPDGDSLGSQIALYELLKMLEKDVEMVCNSEIPYQYKFLPNVDKIRSNFKDTGVDCLDGDCIFFCLDSADEERFNIRIDEIRSRVKKIINIDHHLGNSAYGDINIVDFRKSATGEILYEFIEREYPESLNYNIALGLYTAILTDTGRFQYENTTSNVHGIVSRLLEFGIVPSSVFSFIYESEPLNRFKLLELVLKRVEVVRDKKLVYSYVLQKDFDRLGLPFSANDGVIEMLRSASEAKIAALFKQIGTSDFKVSLRSTDENYNVAEIASKFGGGGHKMASAYSAKGDLKKIIRALIKAIKNK
jgi:phosphoesterase RecJ-like protein